MDFDFLKDLEVPEPVKQTKARSSVGAIPIEGDFRVLRNGKIFFAEELGARVKDCWLDFVYSKTWESYPQDKPAVYFLHINEVNEKAPKADVKKEGDSVYIVREFLPNSSNLWNIDWENTTFVDFKLADIAVPAKIMAMPKVVQRGVDKGKPDYVRRENVSLVPFEPVSDFKVLDTQAEISFDGKKEEEEIPDANWVEKTDGDIRDGM